MRRTRWQLVLQKPKTPLTENQLAGEIIVADNGSTDGSYDIAKRLGARVIHVTERGYGNTLMQGIAAARGELIIMGDADDSYDFREIPNFVVKLRQGFDIVQGCRLRSGGGTIIPGAMPFLHRIWGNPNVFLPCPALVQITASRRLLRNARLPKGLLQSPRSTLRGNGIRHRDDHQGEPAQQTDQRDSDYASSRRQKKITRRTYARFATVGVPFVFFWFTARAGYFCCPECFWFASVRWVTPSHYLV